MSLSAAISLASRLQVLLVEDNLGDVELVRDAADDLDVDVQAVYDGEKALDFLRGVAPFETAPRPDLILLDLKLPRRDGLEVLAEIGRDTDLKRIPVVVLTSSRAPQDVARAYALNAMACFAKPTTGLGQLLSNIVGFVRQTLPNPETGGPTGPPLTLAPGRPPVDEVRSRRHLAAIVDSADDAIIGADAKGTIVSWNRAAEVLFGYRSHQAVGRHLRLIIPNERAPELEEVLTRAAAGLRAQRMRVARATEQGRELHVALAFSPIRDSAGAVIGVSAVARDISEQVQAEARFRLAVEASPSAMVVTDADQRIVIVNHEAERLFGYDRHELIGESTEQLVPERFRSAEPDRPSPFDRTPAHEPAYPDGLVGLRKDGTEVPVEVTLKPIETPKGTLTLQSIVDVSAQHRAEQRFRLAVEASPSGMVMVDEAGSIVLANAEAERQFGYGRDELAGLSIDVLVPTRFRRQHSLHRASFDEAPVARPMGSGRELNGLRNDGSEFPVEIGLNPIEDGSGRLTLATIVDISARKQAEKALAEQARALLESNEDLEQFAYAASHDLQEPLRMVSSYTALLAERYGARLDETARRYVAYAQDGASRMQTLIDDLLVYSRVRSRGRALAPTRASEALEAATQNLALAIRESKAVITSTVDATVLADPTQLIQVFQNLLSNALRFRQQDTPRIAVSAEREGEQVVFAVRDNGIGIHPEHAERVFQMFQRLHTRDEYDGTGIGLALCRRIIDRHGGSIWVESDGVGGSTFFFTLSAAPSPDVAFTAAQKAE